MTNPISPSHTVAPRYDLLDITRGFGILLVIYGHFLQSFFQPDAPLIADQYRFLYSFHMPLFFILSGMVGQIGTPTFRKNLRGGLELIALVVLVHIIGIGIDLLTRDQTLDWSTPEILRDGFRTGNAAVGVMWFLLCLGLVRLTVGSALLIRNRAVQALAIAALLALFAYAYSQHGPWPVWQDTTLFFGALFFLIGRFAPLRWLALLSHPLGLIVTVPLTLACAFLNDGGDAHPIIMMMGEYNSYPLFVLGAVSGTVMCLQLCALFAHSPGPHAALTGIGRQTLGLLILNAFYCAFLMPLVQAHLPHDGVDTLTLTVAALGLTLLQVLVFTFMKPATDSLAAIAHWIARSIARA